MAYRLARRAEADLDDIAHYIATESGSLDTATRVIEALTDRFLFLADGPDGEASLPTAMLSFIAYRARDVLILRVAHGSRDIRALMRV